MRSNLETELEKRRPYKRGPVENNPYADVTDLATLEKTLGDAEETIRSAQEALEDHEDSSSDEVIMTLENGRELTKSEVRKMRRAAEEARNVYLPDQIEKIQQGEKYEKQRQANRATVEEAHPWLKEEGNSLREAYEQIAPPIVEQLKTAAPEFYPNAELALADHAYMSVLRSRNLVPSLDQKPRQPLRPTDKPPSGPTRGAAPSGRPQSGKRQALEATHEQFVKTGSRKALESFLVAKNKD